ncbi:hypothetical protein yfred0001_2410 [Yersinia frederiksenii ATCC 33641]|nr:hypothetical protein yfred0001_2410 [Yersinia frederiksenii ATCC 33641]
MFAVLMIVIVTALGFSLKSSLFSSLENLMHNELTFRSTLLGPYISAQGTTENWRHVELKLTALTENEGGKVTYITLSKRGDFNLGDPKEIRLTFDKLNDGFSTAPNSDSNYPWYLLVETIKPLGSRPELKFIVALNSKPYYSTLREFTRSMTMICIIGLLMVIILSNYISRFGLRPARKLSEQANALPPGQLKHRLDTETLPSELYSLAVAFNGVLERQETAWKQLESFNANVAHELRTPLTNLIGQTQLWLSKQRDAEELEELLQSNLEEFDRMTSIVNDMLFLSHAESGRRATDLNAVSLQKEILKTGEYVEPTFMEKNISLKVEGNVLVSIDKRLFHRALANLLENGARYAFPDSTVSVVLSKKDNYVYVAVSNAGDPIDEEHLGRLFERFYRIDAARNLSNTHHGLGLAIVKAVALMHGGKIFADSKNGINTFGFTLKLGSAEEDDTNFQKRKSVNTNVTFPASDS